MTGKIGELYLEVELYDNVELTTFAKIPITHNGTKCLIFREGSVIVGQMEATITFSGQPITTTNKSSNDWVKTIDSILIGKQIQVSGTITYNNNSEYRQLRTDVKEGNKANYTIEYISGESFSAFFKPSGLNDTAVNGDKITTSITLLSTATVMRVSI